jgi:penicillin-binding protein 1A
MLTIFANRIYLGPDLIGVQQGSKFYFNKNSVDLTIPEAALLVAVMRSPTVYSPAKHPDRALGRRNTVIDAMLESGSITVADTQASKPLHLALLPA